MDDLIKRLKPGAERRQRWLGRLFAKKLILEIGEEFGIATNFAIKRGDRSVRHGGCSHDRELHPRRWSHEQLGKEEGLEASGQFKESRVKPMNNKCATATKNGGWPHDRGFFFSAQWPRQWPRAVHMKVVAKQSLVLIHNFTRKIQIQLKSAMCILQIYNNT